MYIIQSSVSRSMPRNSSKSASVVEYYVGNMLYETSAQFGIYINYARQSQSASKEAQYTIECIRIFQTNHDPYDCHHPVHKCFTVYGYVHTVTAQHEIRSQPADTTPLFSLPRTESIWTTVCICVLLLVCTYFRLSGHLHYIYCTSNLRRPVYSAHSRQSHRLGLRTLLQVMHNQFVLMSNCC